MYLTPANQHLVWNGLDQASNTKKRTECGVRRISAIEAENELIQVCLEMRPAQTMVDALGPRLEVGEGDVYPGQDDVGGHRADDVGIVSDLGRSRIAGPAVGLGGAPRLQRRLDEGVQAVGRIILDHGQAQASRLAVVDLDPAYDQHLALVAASAAAGRRVVLGPQGQACLVDLDDARQRMALGMDHRPAQLARQHPGRPIRTEPEHRLELQRRDAVRMRRHQKCRQKPRSQWQFAGVHDRSGRHRGLAVASGALEGIGLALQRPFPIRATRRTDEPPRPAQRIQVGGAGSLVRKALLKFNQ